MHKFAHVTDIHLEEEFPKKHGVNAKSNWLKILDDIASRGVTHLIFTGDIGSSEAHDWFFNSMEPYRFNVRLVLGNHDRFTEVGKYYRKDLLEVQDELFYMTSDSYGTHVYLDTSSDVLSERQVNWLLAGLHEPERLFLFVHHPLLDTGTTPQREYPLEGGEVLLDALHGLNCDVHIFCGHLHMEDDQQNRNVSQYVTPASCFQLKKQSETTEIDNLSFGYRMVEINSMGVRTELILFD